jgi:hypothetical protein
MRTESESSQLEEYNLSQAGLIKSAKKGRSFGFGNIRDDKTGHRPAATTFLNRPNAV